LASEATPGKLDLGAQVLISETVRAQNAFWHDSRPVRRHTASIAFVSGGTHHPFRSSTTTVPPREVPDGLLGAQVPEYEILRAQIAFPGFAALVQTVWVQL
jgi:hypothetical protein